MDDSASEDTTMDGNIMDGDISDDNTIDHETVDDNASDGDSVGECDLHYRSDCPSLPVNRAPGFPHIIKLDNFSPGEMDTSTLSCADGVATFLWMWDKVQFDRFFDLTRSKFMLHYKETILDMIISRDDRTVTAGFRVDDGLPALTWDPKLVFVIQPDGSWKPSSCYSPLQAGTDTELVGELGRMFSETLLTGESWDVAVFEAKVTVHQ